MFVKLTRFDNTPVWLNASFVVTVEPRKGGVGSVVVPIGDGLDYDVREQPEAVLALLDGAPAPAVVPVPVSDALTKTPDDVSPADVAPLPDAPPADESAAKPRAARASRKTAKPRAAAKKEKAEAPAGEPAAAPSETAPAAEQTVAAPAVEPTEMLSEDLVERLQKMAPKTVAKLHNTLMKQFKVADAASVVNALVARGILTVAGTRVSWEPAQADW